MSIEMRPRSVRTVHGVFGRSTEYAFPNDTIGTTNNEHILSYGEEIRRIGDHYPIARCQRDEESDEGENGQSKCDAHDLISSLYCSCVGRNGCRSCHLRIAFAVTIIHSDDARNPMSQLDESKKDSNSSDSQVDADDSDRNSREEE